jgi:hypothetical protein
MCVWCEYKVCVRVGGVCVCVCVCVCVRWRSVVSYPALLGKPWAERAVPLGTVPSWWHSEGSLGKELAVP